MNLVRLTIKGISYSHTQNGAYALILNEVDGERKLPIVIGAFEAQAIAIALEKELKSSRPLTHDLFKTFAQRFDITLKEVIIHKLVDGVFYSSLVFDHEGAQQIIDARTSDAVSLAIRFKAPIFTYMNILDKAGIILKEQVEEDEAESEESDEEFEEALKEFVDGPPYTAQQEVNEFAQLSLEDLKQYLDSAVQNEDYEKAARLRDEIEKRNK